LQVPASGGIFFAGQVELGLFGYSCEQRVLLVHDKPMHQQTNTRNSQLAAFTKTRTKICVDTIAVNTPSLIDKMFSKEYHAPELFLSLVVIAMQIYISGNFFDKENAKVSVFDHGFLYGDGVFEGMRSYNGKVFRLRDHMTRLWNSAKSIAVEIPMTREAMEKAVNDTLKINDITDGYIRLIVTRGIGTLGLDAHLCRNPQVIIIADQLALYPKEFYEKGLEIVTASTIRTNPSMVSPQVKSLNYLNNILAKIEGHQAGCIEVLMLNTKGEVAECSGDNIFICRKGTLHTPPPEAGILEGITRQTVLEIAADLQIPVKESPMTRHDIYTADECFLTGSGAELIPVIKLDGRIIGTGKPGEMTKKLLAKFQEETKK
jgi:branched-chain amino acid aminotransferase